MDSEQFDVFVGREDELDELHRLLEETKRGGGRAIFISGEAGIGKSRLVRELEPIAEDMDYDFLMGRCELDNLEPYMPFRKAFEKYLEDGSEDSTDNGGIKPVEGENGTRIKDEDMLLARRRASFFETTKFVKEVAGKTPLVIFLDDLQWADQGTLNLFHYLTDNLDQVPVLLIGTYRPGDVTAGHPLDENIHRMARKHLYEEIELESFDISTTEDLISSLLSLEEVPEDFVDWVYQKTGGNPLFIKESIRQMVEDGLIDPDKKKFPESPEDVQIPDPIQNVIERRIFCLDGPTRKILQMGSVIGEKIPFDLLTESTQVDELDLLSQVDKLIESKLWKEGPSGDTFYFTHALIADTIYKGLGKWLEKKRLHRKVAEAIETAQGDKLDEMFSTLAHHHEMGEQYQEALEYYIEAGKRAERMYVHEDAIEMYKKARKISDRFQQDQLEVKRSRLMEREADALKIVGDYEDALNVYEQAVELEDEKREKADLHRKIAEVYESQGRLDESLEECRAGLIHLEDEDAEEEVRLLSKKGWTLMRKGDYAEAQEVMERGLKTAQELDIDKEIAQARHDIGTIFWKKGEFDKALDQMEKALEIRRKIGDLSGESDTLNNIGVVYRSRRDLDSALEYYEESLEIEGKIGNKKGEAGVLNNLGIIYEEKGALDQALEHYKRARDIFRRMGVKHGLADSLSNLGVLHWKMGDLEKALRFYQGSLKITEEMGDKQGMALSLSNLGLVCLEKQEMEKALDSLKKSLDISRDIGNKRGISRTLAMLGETYSRLGEYDTAREEIEESLQISKEIGATDMEGFAHRVRGIYYRERGDHDKGLEEFKTSEELLREANKTEVPRTVYEKGLLLQRKGDDEDAEKAFEEALEQAEEMNLGLWVERCKKALDR